MSQPRAADLDVRVEVGLRRLGVAAPPRLAPATFLATGVADAYAPIDTPLGRALVTWNERGLSSISWPADPASLERDFPAARGRRVFAAPLPVALAGAIERRLAGARRARVPLDLRGSTPFEQAVWRKTLEIPRGEVRPYGWVASEIGRPAAVRAVGTALGHNPIPLVIPCHRVVRSDGTIGQYSMGGPESKRRILQAEGLDPAELERTARAGVRFVGSTTTRIVCLPTCHSARRIGSAHRVPFRSLATAAAAGYRPCRACRPGGTAAA
jgi:O-6-methylguanine DNA methyltransferase